MLLNGLRIKPKRLIKRMCTKEFAESVVCSGQKQGVARASYHRQGGKMVNEPRESPSFSLLNCSVPLSKVNSS